MGHAEYLAELAEFAGDLAAERGRAAAYSRGELTAAVTVVREQTLLAGVTPLGDRKGQFYAEIVDPAELILGGLRVRPKAGDRITISQGGAENVYEVAAPEKHGFVYEEIFGGTRWRVFVVGAEG